MVAPLQALLSDLERALAANDLDGAASVRRAILSEHPATEAGAEASYKLGLDALFRRADLGEAVEHLRVTAKTKTVWSPLARNSLGIILLRQGKMQQAIFEFRKVAGMAPPTILSASAWGLLVAALRQNQQAKEAERARMEHKRILAKLCESRVPEDAAIAHFMLGMEHKFDGERGVARKHIEAALTGTALPERERRQAEAALKEL